MAVLSALIASDLNSATKKKVELFLKKIKTFYYQAFTESVFFFSTSSSTLWQERVHLTVAILNLCAKSLLLKSTP